MKKRIYGLETEYGTVLLSDDCSTPEWDYTAYFFDIIEKKILPAERCGPRDLFYANGARIYRDCGEHPEYATPECAGIRDVVKWDKAGERILEAAAERTNQILTDEGRGNFQLRLYKNNRDNADSTFGCHENYLVSRKTDFNELTQFLISFLVSRQILCGAGWIDANGFQISQRADFITEINDPVSTSRPIVHTKDSPLADRELWRRLHLVLGDANMSQISAFLKVGTTALVLQMVESGFMPGIIRLEDPVAALRAISRDPSCRTAVPLARPLTRNGPDYLSAVEIQELYLNWAKKFLSRFTRINPEWRLVAERWERAISFLKEDPTRLFREIDWVAKKWLMASVLKKCGCGWDDFREILKEKPGQTLLKRLKTIDFLYHDIRRDHGLYNLLEKEDVAEKLVGEEEIEEAKTEPPRNTRANWRSDLIRLVQNPSCRDKKMTVTIQNWEQASFYGVHPGGIHLNPKLFTREDPFDSKPPDAAEILSDTDQWIF